MRPTLLLCAFALTASLATEARSQEDGVQGFSPYPPGISLNSFRTAEEKAEARRKAYTLAEEGVEIVRLDPVKPGGIGINPPAKPPVGGPITPGSGGDTLVVIDRIVNLAKKVWDIIKENRPVVDIETSYANALPSGIDHWGQLENWGAPQGVRYGFYAKNLYGVRVVDVEYTVLRTYGGSYKGKGKYLQGVTIEPSKVSVAWGYTFNMKANVPSVGNVGSSEDPVASVIARLNWTMSTVLKSFTGTSTYHLQGDGKFRELSGPFKSQERQEAEKMVQRLSELLPQSAAGRFPEGIKARAALVR